jgi:hypothetical protein
MDFLEAYLEIEFLGFNLSSRPQPMPKLVAFLQFVGSLVVAYFAVRVAATIWNIYQKSLSDN